jgi:Transposase DDE domain group 1
MTNPAGESNEGVLRLDFDRRLMLQFRGSVVTSDAGLLPYRELDDVLGLTSRAGETLADARTGRNGRHALVGMFRQSVFGRLAGYEDVNDAERLRHDPAMRWIVGGKAAFGCAASPSQMGRLETRWLRLEKNLSALADLSGQWIDRVHSRRPPRRRARYGFERESDAWRTRDERLERPL